MTINLVLLSAGLALSFYMAWTLGANDAATPTGCAVGAGIISISRALILFAIFSTVGAMTQGFMVITTIGKGLIPNIDLLGAITVVLAACIWVTFCTWKGLDISNTHSVIGSIIGYSLIVYGSVEMRLFLSIIAAWIVSPLLSASLASIIYRVLGKILGRYNGKRDVQRIIQVLFIASLCFSAYCFGANDVGNATGVYVSVTQQLGNMPDYNTMLLLSAFGSLGIAVGGLTWGRRVVETVAYRIVRLDPLSGLSAETATALIVFFFVTVPYTLYGYGLPVSTSIASIGSILGVGLLRDKSAINKKTMARLATSWIATPLVTAVLCITMYKILATFFR